MKRFLSVLLAVVMTLALAVPAMAEIQNHKVTPLETPNIYVTTDKESVPQGETFTMAVNLSGDYQATALTIRVFYDEEKLEYVDGSVAKGEVLQAVQRAGGMALAEQGTTLGAVVSCSAMIFTAGNSFSATGVVYSCSFRVKEDVEVGEVISFEPDIDEFTMLEVGETIATPIEHTTAGASITVAAPPEGVFIKAVPSKTEVEGGETFTVQITISGDYAAGELDVKLPFDNTLFSVGTITNGEVLEEADDLGHTIKITTPNNNTVRIRAYNGDEAFSATGVIATIEFTVIAEESASYNFLPTVSTFADMDENDIENTVAGATVNITVNVEPEDVVFHVTPSKDLVAPGETFTVELSITGTYAAHSITWRLLYDPELFECVSYEEGAVLDAARDNGGSVLSQINESNVGVVIIMPTDALTATGTILTATFTVKEGATGTYEFMPEVDTFLNYPTGGSGTEIEYELEGGTVTIGEPQPVVFTATASKEEVEVGETFTVELALSGEYAGHSITWRLLYDPELFECVSFEEGAVLDAARDNGGSVLSQINENNVGVVIIMPTDALTAEGTILTATFTVKEGASGSYEFMPEVDTFLNYPTGGNGTEIEYELEGSTVTITAPATYEITFKVDGQDDVVITVNAGETPEYPYGTPIKQADAQYTYTFAGWDPEIVPAAEDATYTAVWDQIVNKYTVTWIIDDQQETQEYEYGETPTHEDPVKEGYTFTGWDPEIVAVTENATYTAQFTVKSYRLTIYYLNEATGFAMPGATAVFADIEYGAEYSYTSPEITGYHLVDEAQAVISGTMPAHSVEIDVYYAINVYTITFVNEDGTELQTVEVQHGTTPEYTGETPTKENTQFAHYEFIGWTPNIVPATENVTYTAVFEETPAPYSVKFYVKNDVLATVNAYYLTEDDMPAQVNWYGYQFTGWDMTLDEINTALENGDVEVHANFEPLANTFTVTIHYLNEVTTKEFTESRWITVKAKSQIGSQYFQYWTMNGVVISYSPRANVRVVDDCDLVAVYGDEAPAEVTAVAQLMKATYADNRITFLFYFAAPDGATIDQAGIWACNGDDFESYGGVLDADHHRFERFCSISDATQPASYTWIKTNVAEGDTWYVRPFITYTLNGEETTFVGGMIKIVAGTDYDIGDAN